MHHKAKKHLGQNFLHDPHVIQNIIRQAHIQPTDHLIEVGPGLGALTTQILPIVKNLNVIELDDDVIPILKENCAPHGTLSIHHQSALEFDFTQFVTEQNWENFRLIGNLPYNISSPLIFHFINHASVIADMHFMLQKEVVQRLCAEPGTKNYGRMSVMVQYFCRAEALFVVPPGAFTPAPKIDSQIVRLTPYTTPPFIAQNFDHFSEIVKAAFSQRRKTLRNTLKKHTGEDTFHSVNINPSARAETLSVEQFVQLSNAIQM